MLQIGVVVNDLGANQFYGEYHSFDVEGIYLIWSVVDVQRIDFTIAPGVQVQFYWLLV